MAGEYHYPVGGSTVELAGLCPGSVKARIENPQPAGAAAARGTRIHSYAELLWKAKHQGYTHTKEDKELIKTLDDMERRISIALVQALELLCQKYGYLPTAVRVEEQFAFVQPIAGGTPDAFAFRLFGDFLMVDVKTGYKKVKAANNLQLLFYICTILRNLSKFEVATFENFHLVILQSEQDAPVVHVDTWTTTREEIAKYDGHFEQVVANVTNNPDKRTPGEHCNGMYCAVSTTCKEHIAYLNQQSEGRLDLLQSTGTAPTNFKGAELAKAIKANVGLRAYAKSIIDNCEAIENEAYQLLLSVPDAVPGYKLEQAFDRNRSYVDSKAVEAKAKELGLKSADIKTKAELLSPNQLETQCKILKVDHAWIDTMTTKRAKGYKMVEGQALSPEQIFAAAI